MTDQAVRSEVRVSPLEAVSIRAHILALLLTGLLLLLCYPPVGWGILSHVALVPLVLVAVRSHKPWRLVWLTWLVFTIWWGVMLMWLHPVTPGGYMLGGAFLAIYAAAAVLLIRQLHRFLGRGLVLIVPAVWVAMEFLRDQLVLGGFGWFTLAQAISPYDPSHRVPWLLQVADLFGPWTVSFALAMTNGLIADLLVQPWVGKNRQGRARVSPALRGALLLWGAVVFGGILYGYTRQSSLLAELNAEDRAPGLHVAAIQSNTPQSHRNKPTLESMELEWERQLQLTLEAQGHEPKPDLIVWPESTVPAALNPEALLHYQTTDSGWRGAHAYHLQLTWYVGAAQAALLTGASAQFDWEVFTGANGKQYEQATRRYNSVYLYQPDGKQDPLRYDKQHLVPFGEFIPWIGSSPTLKQWFIDYLSPYPFDYSLNFGKRPVVFTVPVMGEPRAMESPSSADGIVPRPPRPVLGEVRVATPICFEDTVSRVCREMVYSKGQKRSDVLVNVTNDGWFVGTREPVLHLQASVLRCVELRVPMVRSVNTGVSGFIDVTGRVGPLIDVGGKRAAVDGFVVHEMLPSDRITLYGRVGSWPMWGVCGVVGVLAILSWWVRRSLRRG